MIKFIEEIEVPGPFLFQLSIDVFTTLLLLILYTSGLVLEILLLKDKI